MPLLEGIKYGIFLVLMIGPSFFYLIKVSIRKGIRCAAGFALGILITDIFFILIIYFGLSEVFKKIEVQFLMSVIAGVTMLVLGLKNIQQPRENHELDTEEATNRDYNFGLVGFVMKGIAINGLNPFTIILWIAVLATVMASKSYADIDFLQFFIGLLATIVMADISKAFLANKIAKVLTIKTLGIVDKILGYIFILLGLRFFYFAAVNYELVF